MTTVWASKKLGEVCKFVGGGTPSKQRREYWGGDIPWVSPKDMKSDTVTDSLDRITEEAVKGSAAKWIPEKAILIVVRSGILSRTVPIALSGRRLTVNQDLKAIVAGDRLDPRFLFYFLKSAEQELLGKVTRGATVHKLDMPVIKDLPIPLPPLEEQRRIVAVLDEAFEGLARARVHAEANLQNARELVQSNIDAAMTSGSIGWDEYVVEDTLQRVRIPNKIKRTEYLERGEFPVVSQEAALVSGYWDNSSDVIRVERPLVVFGDHTRALKFVDFDFVVGADGTQLMSPIKKIEPDFFFYALRAIRLEGKGYARHFSHLKKEKLSCPRDQSHQRAIACRLREVERTAEELIENYEKKCSDLDELRQSLLRRAFAGELT